MDEIKIPLSKNKLIFELKGSIVFILLGIYLYNTMADQLPVLYAFFVGGIGMIGMLFFGWTAYHAIRKLAGHQVGLIINSAGIIDYTNATSIGLIPWSDIAEIKTAQIMTTRNLLLFLFYPAKVIAKQRWLKKILVELNMKIYGTPISITSNTLKIDHLELEKLLLSGLENYRIRTPNV